MKIRKSKLDTGSKIKDLLKELRLRLKPLENYYISKTERERQLLLIGGVCLILMLIYLMISSVVSFGNDLETSYNTIQNYRADSLDLVRRYKYVSKLTPNEFSTVSVDRIKGDITQVLDIKTPDVQIIDSTLTIKVDKAKFSLVMELLNQLRKSYGLYPDKLKITRLSDSGFVALNVSFYNVNKDNE